MTAGAQRSAFEPSTGRSGTGKPSTGKPSTGKPSTGKPSAQVPKDDAAALVVGPAPGVAR